MKFIHLTDPHVIGGRRTLYGGDPAERLARAVESVNREHGDAAFVVVTGDLTHWGEPDAYTAFRREIGRLAMPAHLLVGNHDDRAAFADAFPEAPRDGDGFVQSALETPEGTCVFLDTKAEGTHAGAYCAARRAWLAARLEEAAGDVLLFMHHPPFDVGIGAMDAIKLAEAEAFHEVVAPYKPRIRHLFFGHVHRAIFGSWRGVPVSCMRGLNHQVAPDLAEGSAGIMGDFAPPAYGVVLWTEDQVTVHLHDFSDASRRFPLLAPEGGDHAAYALAMEGD